MKAIKMERIVKTYYDALEEGKVLGRKCPVCGHIEYPPYLACNECGNLDTEWVDLTNVRAHVTQILPALKVFPETEFKKKHGGYMAICVQIGNADPYVTSLLHVPDERYQELHDNLENVIVKPFIIEKEGMKVVEWVLEDYEGKPEDDEEPAIAAEPAKSAAQTVSEDAVDEIAQKVIICAAEGYGVDAATITLGTDIREDLSNESMKMIIMISSIEEELGVTIDIPDAGNMNTIRDFVIAVKERLGVSTETAMDSAPIASVEAASADAADTEELDEIAQKVISCAAEGYGVDATTITLGTDIREDLSNESMKMIVMISSIEEELGVTIDIPDAANMNTIRDFVQAVKDRMQ